MSNILVALSLLSIVLTTRLGSAELCNFEFSRSNDGSLTRIASNNNQSSALIKTSDGSLWNAIVRNADSTVSVNQTGLVEEISFVNTTLLGAPNEKYDLDTFLEQELKNGTHIKFQDGHLSIRSTNGKKIATSAHENGTHFIALSKSGDDFIVANVEIDSNLTDVFVQNQTIVTVIDDQCRLMTLPLNATSNEIQSAINQLGNLVPSDSEPQASPSAPPSPSGPQNQQGPPPPPPFHLRPPPPPPGHFGPPPPGHFGPPPPGHFGPPPPGHFGPPPPGHFGPPPPPPGHYGPPPPQPGHYGPPSV